MAIYYMYVPTLLFPKSWLGGNRASIIVLLVGIRVFDVQSNLVS